MIEMSLFKKISFNINALTGTSLFMSLMSLMPFYRYISITCDQGHQGPPLGASTAGAQMRQGRLEKEFFPVRFFCACENEKRRSGISAGAAPHLYCHSKSPMIAVEKRLHCQRGAERCPRP